MSIHDSASESTLTANQNPAPEGVSVEDWEITLPAWLGGRQPTDADKAAALFPLNPFKYIRMVGYDKSSSKKDTVTGTSPPSFTVLEQHLSCIDAVGSIGYLPGSAQETTVGCVDIDNKGKTAEAFQAETKAIQQALRRYRVAFNLERSTNGGHHLWVFLTEPAPYATIRDALKFVTAQAGFPGVEVFPKGDARSNAIYLPYRGALSNGLGRTFLEHSDGTPIPLQRVLDEVRLADTENIDSLATKTNANPPAKPVVGSSPTYLPAGLELLKQAALKPTEGFQRHDSIEAFLNVAERMGKQDEMAEFLKSDEVYSVWVTDGSRTPEAWGREIERWKSAKSDHQRGLPFLMEQGFVIPELPQVGQSGRGFQGRATWQQSFEALQAKYAPPSQAGKSARVQFFRAHEIKSIERPEALVEGVLVRRSLCALVGESGAGKSMVALDIAMHVALGREWHGRKVVQGNAVYLAAEALPETAHRFRGWCDYHKVQQESVPMMLGDISLALTDVSEGGGFEELLSGLQTLQSDWGGLELIVVDTVARTFGEGDENSNTDMVRYTNCAELMSRVFGCTVWIIHHTGKDASKGGRGASAFKAPLEMQTTLTNEGGWLELEQTKNRGGMVEKDPIRLGFVSHIWEQNGETVKVGVLSPDAPATGVDAGNVLTDKQVEMLEALIGIYDEFQEDIQKTMWRQSATTVPKETFRDNVPRLVKREYVVEVVKGKKYRPTDKARDYLKAKANAAGEQA